MKSKLSAILFSAVLAVSSLTLAGNAAASGEARMLGPMNKVTMSADGKSAVAELTDSKTKEAITITITDELTLDKFKAKQIVPGDEIRARYMKDGKNTSKSFKKAAGC
ncbi:MAG: hypothetical protein KKF85_03170 [Gammaproteobacteria bacterium]|nr:hypothetical protein [Rhodocyclaceae bacterium]MBU3908825.1 hypothetical protein [Gammaproteobacteria bacterium]MBU3987692.1 hypothetical protein [Gammaproteobacteria bacterium]MBU4003660.1 hypothetical protein [Gammaproteobacteria bacterium]MBU4021774.1 hypothetical protein [Gammaproteobacteria bacterium]